MQLPSICILRGQGKMKKKILRVLICMTCLVLGYLFGCPQETKEEQPAQTQEVRREEEEVKEEETPQPTPIPENENILTGIGNLTDEAIGKRPVAVMVNNIEAALPQYGISKADVIFEIPVEGSLTRLMALYGDYTTVPKICPIRSCRYYFPALAKGFDAYYVHWGSDQSIVGYVNSLGIDRYDGMANTLGLFGRDQAKRNSGYALEHTGYFDGTRFAQALEDKGVRTDLADNKKGTAFRFCGMDDTVTPKGGACSSLDIRFGASSSGFEYKESAGKYVKTMNGHAHIDGKTKNQLKFTNLFILETSIGIRDEKGHRSVDWAGGSQAVGYYVSNGRKQKITWSKAHGNEGSYLKFYNKKGKELKINRGKSYIAFISPGQVEFHP